MTDAIRSEPRLTYAAARGMVAAAIAHADANGWGIAVAVLDPSGHVLASGRMDGVPPSILDFATDKAFTATLGKTSLAFGERMAELKSLEMGLASRKRLLTWEGGFPVRAGSDLIGSIGISGASGHEDAACARAGIDAIGLTS
ncbi:MAG: heme-binding protein [Silicimonas sp.]|jgi:glc operon protein GlcG|nr:heme-binding protein [Silicimonas sp.]